MPALPRQTGDITMSDNATNNEVQMTFEKIKTAYRNLCHYEVPFAKEGNTGEDYFNTNIAPVNPEYFRFHKGSPKTHLVRLTMSSVALHYGIIERKINYFFGALHSVGMRSVLDDKFFWPELFRKDFKSKAETSGCFAPETLELMKGWINRTPRDEGRLSPIASENWEFCDEMTIKRLNYALCLCVVERGTNDVNSFLSAVEKELVRFPKDRQLDIWDNIAANVKIIPNLLRYESITINTKLVAPESRFVVSQCATINSALSKCAMAMQKYLPSELYENAFVALLGKTGLMPRVIADRRVESARVAYLNPPKKATL